MNQSSTHAASATAPPVLRAAHRARRVTCDDLTDLPQTAHAATCCALCANCIQAAGHSRRMSSPALMARVATRLRPIDTDFAQRNDAAGAAPDAAAAAPAVGHVTAPPHLAAAAAAHEAAQAAELCEQDEGTGRAAAGGAGFGADFGADLGTAGLGLAVDEDEDAAAAAGAGAGAAAAAGFGCVA